MAKPEFTFRYKVRNWPEYNPAAAEHILELRVCNCDSLDIVDIS